MRLYPTPPINVRFANKATVLPRGGGADGKSPVLLTKGAGIAWSAYHLHRTEAIYGADAGIYRPQRWEGGELLKKARPGAGYLDFNGGPRLCLGSKQTPYPSAGTCPSDSSLTLHDAEDFALTEASYALIKILKAYPDIRLAPGVPNEPVGVERQTYTVGLFPTDGVQVSLK